MSSHHKIDYVEFPSTDLKASKIFFNRVFGWGFMDYGPDYASFSGEGINGGFYTSALKGSVATGSALVVIYSNNIEETAKQVQQAGGKIVKDIFSFPGGRRFHFTEPGGTEFAVWSE